MKQDEAITAPSPLAEKTLAALRKVATGNGIKPDRITLAREEHGLFSLHGVLAMTLDVARTSRQEVGRPKGVHVFATREEMEGEIVRARAGLIQSPAAMDVIQKEVLGGPAGGYGSDQKILPVKGLGYQFGIVTSCATCKGQGKGGCPVCEGRGRISCPQCNGNRQEWCGHCRGTGWQDGDQSKPRCTYCGGDGRTSCLRCSGQGMITCQPCNGTGHSHCKTCRGAGELTDTTTLDFAWRTRFIPHTADIPRAVSHLMSQGSLEALAAKGHLTPQTIAGPLDAPPRLNEAEEESPRPAGELATLYWHMQADVPWCEAVIKIGQSTFIATAAGHKGRVNNCATFLDKIAGKAPRLRMEALSALLRLGGGKKADREIARLYPIGLSERARHGVLKEAAATIRQRLMAYTIAAWAAALIATGALGWFIRGIQGPVAGFIVGVLLFQTIKLYGQSRFAAEAKVPYKPTLSIGWEAFVLLLLSLLLGGRYFLY